MNDNSNWYSPAAFVRESEARHLPVEAALAPARPTLRLGSRSASSTSAAQPIGRHEGGTLQEAPGETSAQLLALADLMDSWAAALPRWNAEVREPWFVFVERAYLAETALAERLRALPTCRLSMCDVRERISLSLAGIFVRTDKGLGAACRDWAREAPARATP